MADVKWTAAQMGAIDGRGNILVSAAAGSGKTATLSAKIMRLLSEDEASLSRFLIVTFTNAAAAELKERISKEITKASVHDKTMLRHKRDVDSADICTIHSFCLKVIRRYFTVLGISPDFGIADEATAEVLKSRAMETTVDDFFRGDEKFSPSACDMGTLADTVGKTRDAAGLDAELRSLAGRLDSLGYDEGYLRSFADVLKNDAGGEFFASPWGEVIRDEALSAAEHYIGILDEVMADMAESSAVIEKYMPTAEAVRSFLSRVLKSGDSYERMAEAVSSYEAPALGRLSAKDKTEAAEKFKSVRDEVKKTFDKMAERHFISTPKQISEARVGTASVLEGAADVISVYRRRYTEMKRERGLLDFSDLESLALKLLVGEDGEPTPEALEIADGYRHVFIDEYQDTNSVQDRIFRAVSGKAERFFVGDIKQSIYRFRGAEPEVFSGYRRAWSDDFSDTSQTDGYPMGHSIFMSENFRCARPVIEFANAVSRYMFPFGGIPFAEEDCLVYGGVAEGDTAVEVCLIDGTRSKAEEESPVISEAEYTAERIYSLIKNEGYLPSDIAILLRSPGSTGDLYEAAMKARGIPVKRSGGSSFADEVEVMLTLNVLRAVDNPMRDIPLAGAMMSSVFGFTLDEMVALRREDTACPLYTSVLRYAERDTALGEKCRLFADKLTSLRNAERGMSADRFIEYLYAECGMLRCAEVTSKLYGEKNLHMLHELARSYEKGVFGGLYGFLAFIDEKLQSGVLTTEGKNDADGVTIISIHKSKGLEYKVCFLCDCGRERNDADEKMKLLFHKTLGIGLRLPDPGGLILCGNPVRDAVALRIRREAAMEEMRVLYVAMTRAKERLVVTAKCHGSGEDEMERARDAVKYSDSYAALKAKRMIEHILRGVVMAEDSVSDVICIGRDYEAGAGRFSGTSADADTASSDTAAAERARENIAFRYPHEYLSDIPSKLAVSKLYPALLDDADDAPAELALTNDEDIAEEMPMPRFMTGSVDTSPTDRGTATHVFLQFADFSALRSGHIKDELERLVRNRFITEKMASLVNRAQVEKFAADRITERFLSAKRTFREFRFNLLLPAADFTENAELKARLTDAGETVTVQGVFDCVFEDADGKLVLLDYKTDYMSYEERQNPTLGRRKLIERYRLQLTYYREAVLRLFGRYPDETYIYSLALGEAIAVEG